MFLAFFIVKLLQKGEIHMKDMNIKVAYLTMVLCIAGTAVSMTYNDSEIKMVSDLLKKRTDIMESTLSGEISFEEGKRLLASIEKDKLYTDDIKSIRAFRNKNYDKITDMKLLSLEKINHVSDLMLFEGEIQWIYDRNDIIYSQNNVYNIGVSEEVDQSKLVYLELQ